MLTLREHAEVNTLYRKYISTRFQPNLLELYGVLRREVKMAESGQANVSRGLLRELRAERNRVSYLAHKAIDRQQLKQPFAPFADYIEWSLSKY